MYITIMLHKRHGIVSRLIFKVQAYRDPYCLSTYLLDTLFKYIYL